MGMSCWGSINIQIGQINVIICVSYCCKYCCNLSHMVQLLSVLSHVQFRHISTTKWLMQNAPENNQKNKSLAVCNCHIIKLSGFGLAVLIVTV